MTKDLTKGSPMRLLLSFGVPILFGFLFQQLYNVVDTAIVGQTLGGNALAAVGSTSSISFLVVGFTTGVCGGFAIPIAQQFGARNERELRRYVAGSLWLCLIVGLLLTAATVLLCGDILTLMDTPQDIYHRAWLYIVTIFAGMPGYFLYNMCAGILRSLGDSRTPVIWLVAASLLNVVLDIVCIVTFHMDVFGAAFATIFSQYVAGFGCLVRLCRGFPVLKMEKGDWAWDGRRIRVLCGMGLPMGLQYSITAIGSILIQAAVNHLGTDYITAVTAASKVHLFLCCPFDAMGSTMATYGGQNVGAAKWERLDKTALPAIAQNKDGAYFILGKVAENKALIQDPAKGNHPEVLSKEEFMNRWNGRLLMMTCREFINGKNRKFDISWFIPAVVKYRRLFGEVILASFFLQLFALVSPLLFQVVIDKVLVNRGLSSLDVLMVALICIGIFETLLGGLRTYTFSHTTTRVDVELGASLFKHLIRLPLSYFGVRRVGDTVARVHELESIRNFLTGSTLTLIIDFFFTIIFFTVMFFYSKTLTLLVLLSIPFYVLMSLFFTPILRARIDERFQRGAENQCFLVEAVSGVETVKSLAVEPQMQRRWEQQLAAYVGSSFRASHINNIAGQLVQLVQKITMALTLWIGASLVMKGELSVGQLIAFNMLSGRVTQPILRLAQLWQNFQQAKISIEKLSDILNNPAENTETLSKGSMPEIKGDVEFKDITFRYVPNGPEILKKMNFKVKAGQKIGFVGPSGSGKSTVTKLIQRLYIPESGKVLIDGIDISTVDTAWLRRQIGVVLQENYLFNKSVRENIALTNPAISMDRIIAAAKLAGAHEFITELPDGYDTIIEERGASLSGGQRQRIAIARALVNNPRILIFDEATSALDYESERIIQQNMASICKGRTVFMIAHRLSTVRDCDQIITIEKGEITETGTHDELLKRGGRYAYLWNSQTAPIVPNEVAAE